MIESTPRDGFANLSPVAIDHRYRLLIDAVEDYAIFMLDRSGNVVSWNPGAERAKGYSADEIVGCHFSIFYTDEDAEAGQPARLLAAAKAQGHVEDQGWRIRKDGTRFWAHVVITAVQDEQGELIGFAKITRDLTESLRLQELERVAADTALVQQAQENERKRIARELHDDLGQRISALKMTLSLHETEVQRYIPRDGLGSLTGVRDLADQIDAMAAAMRRLAADLRPPILDDLGLAAAVQWMAEKFEQHYGVSTRCQIEIEDVHLNDLATISLFRVVQEALTNVARHAEAAEVSITLRSDGQNCHVRIRDDGGGLPIGWKLRPDAFGMRGMRERIAQLGGDLSVDGRPGAGVTVSARVPLSRIAADR